MNNLAGYLKDPRVMQFIASLDQEGQNLLAQPSQPNFMRNESTGKVTNLGPSQPSTGMEFDYASGPVDVVGAGKGYRLKNDPMGVYDTSGKKIADLGVDTLATRKRLLEDLNIAGKRQDLEKGRVEIDNARTNIGASRIPQGYRMTPEGNLEAIPGGPADIKAGLEGDKRNKTLASAIGKADLVLGTADTALEQSDWATTGLLGDLRATALGRLSGSSAFDLRKTIDTIKANIGFQELQAMREASPTGGALGQVAVKELDFLQSTLGSLDAGQSEEQLENNINKVKTHYTNWKNAVTGAATANPSPGASPRRISSDAEFDALDSGTEFIAPDGSRRRKP